MKRLVAFLLAFLLISPACYGYQYHSGWNENDIEVGTWSVDGNATTGLGFDPDNDDVNEFTMSPTGSFIIGDVTYPYSDGEDGQGLVTDGAGTLDWDWIQQGNTVNCAQSDLADVITCINSAPASSKVILSCGSYSSDSVIDVSSSLASSIEGCAEVWGATTFSFGSAVTGGTLFKVKQGTILSKLRVTKTGATTDVVGFEYAAYGGAGADSGSYTGALYDSKVTLYTSHATAGIIGVKANTNGIIANNNEFELIQNTTSDDTATAFLFDDGANTGNLYSYISDNRILVSGKSSAQATGIQFTGDSSSLYEYGYLKDNTVTVTNSGAGTSYAVYGTGSKARVNVISGIYSGGTADVAQASSATVNVYGANLVNGTTSGTITLLGELNYNHLLLNGRFATGTARTFTDSDATPDVSLGSLWNTNTSAVTITDFDGTGIKTGQHIWVISKGDITYDCTSSGLKCGTVDITTSTGDTTSWIYDGTDWYIQQYIDSTAAVGGEWTDSGTVLYPNETTDDLALGNSSLVNGAKLSIDGDADQVQFSIQGNATQTSNLITIEQSDGTDVMTLTNAGLLTLATDLDVTEGGTGVSTLADGGLMIGNGSSDVEVVAAGATTQILVGGGANTAPVWGTDIPTAVTIGTAYIYRAGGTDVPVTDGGTGASTLTDGGILLGSGTDAITAMGVLAEGYVIVGDGTTDPVGVAMSGDATIASSGSVTVADDSHAHTSTTISGLDISADTNLSASSGIVLTDDALTHSTANGYVHIPSDGSSAQMLQYSSAGTAKWVTVSSDATIADGGAVTVADDSHAHTTTTISGLDISADTNLTAGRSLTLTDDDIAADAELYTDTKCVWISNPTDADDLKSIWTPAFNVTLTAMWCESDQTVNADLQVDDGSPADVDGTDLVCDTTPATDTSLAGDTSMLAYERLDLAVTSTSGTPTWLSFCWTYTKDD